MSAPTPSTAKTFSISGSAHKGKPVPVVNPIFQECIQYLKDPFWIDIFEKAAQGKFHRGFSYANGFLTYKKKTKSCRLEIPPAAHEAASAIVSFYETTGNVMSISDMQRHHQQMQALLKQDPFGQNAADWKSVKKEANKQHLTALFVDHLAKKYSLNAKQRAQCQETVKRGFSTGCFNNSNVHMVEGRIDRIVGLNYQPDARLFSIDAKCKPKKTNKSRPKKAAAGASVEMGSRVQGMSKRDARIVPFMHLWVKFLEDQQKQHAHLNRVRVLDVNKAVHELSEHSQEPATATPLKTE